MIKLVAISPPAIPGSLGALGIVVCADPTPKMRGWRVAIRGPAVFLISPCGWEPGKALPLLDKSGPRRIVEVPRSECVMQWETDDVAEIEKLQRFDAPAMGVVEEAEDLEALTAPGKIKK